MELPPSLEWMPSFDSTGPAIFQRSPSTLCWRNLKTKVSKVHLIIVTPSFRKAPFSKCVPSTRKQKASVFKFLRFEKRVRDGLELTVVLTEDIKLRLPILPSSMNAVRMTTLDMFCSARAFARIPVCL